MKKICYIIPYFGKLPNNFALWLETCRPNNTINWLIFTNDKTKYDYPKNFKVNYCSFEDIKEKIQKKYDFEICLDRPWKICDFRPAFGEIFEDELKEYDFWGHCDIDLMWGDIRKFITEDMLEKYEKIGFQGHSTLYKNTKEVNGRYKIISKNNPDYKTIFTSSKGYCFDENIICDIYDENNIPYYKETNFAHLSKYDYSFVLKYLPEEDYYKNRRQVLVWENGKLLRYYLDKNNKIGIDEFMYIHFFCRPMTYKVDLSSKEKKYVIYPDIVRNLDKPIDFKFINKYGKNSKLKYYVKSLYYNRKKITIKKIKENIQRMIVHKRYNKY